MRLTTGRGVDTAIEAVGVAATFAICEYIVTTVGVLANVGVHSSKVDLHLERLWSHNVTITTRLVDAISTPTLLKAVTSKWLDPKRLITHRFPLERVIDAYETFGRAVATHALNVILDV